MGKRFLIHPSRKRLALLLRGAERSDGGGADADEVAAHVEQCERCADRFEEMSELEQSGALELDSRFGAALREIYTPPAGINDRVFRKIGEQQRSAQEISLFLGMFGIPSETANLMMPDGSNSSFSDDRRNERKDT